MAITLSEMLKKAKDKGIQPHSDVKDKPWYDGSILKNNEQQTDNIGTTIQQQERARETETNRQQRHNNSTTRAGERNGNKPTTKAQQFNNKSGREKRKQTDNKGTTIQQQERARETETNRQQRHNKRTAIHWRPIASKSETNYQQSDNRLVNILTVQQQFFPDVVGLQRTLFAFIASECHENQTAETKPLFISDFMFIANTDIKTIKTSLYRLEKKQVIFRNKFKSGRGGWTIYGVPGKTWEKINEILK